MAKKPTYEELKQRVKELEQDVRELKRAEGNLRETRDYLENLFNYANAPIIVWNPESRIVRFNHAFEHLTGYKDEEVIGRKLSMLFPEASLDESLNKIQHALSGEYWESVEIPILCKNGDIRVALWNSANIYAEDGTTLLSTIAQGTDISLRKQAEEALRESEEKYRLLVENANDAIFVAQDGVIKFSNRRTEELTGYSAEELRKIPFINHIHPDDKEMFMERHKRSLKGDYLDSTYSYRAINKTGEKLWHLLNIVPITWDGRPATLNFVRDITEAKRLEDQLEQARKMEAISILAGGVAHEFNNALMAIIGNLELLKTNLPEDERRDKYFESMKRSGHRMSRLTDQLLAYAQGGKYQPKDLKLDDVVIETVPILQHDLNSAVSVETHFSKDISYINADQTQMQMVLSVILANSNEAIEDEGLIRITAGNEDVDEDFTKQHPGLKPGPYVCLTIEDNGRGMDEETRNRIFEPFFTTKFQGRGMGMAAVYGIVKNHDGLIYLDSELGKGTAVRIYLPAASAESQVPSAKRLEVDSQSTIVNKQSTIQRILVMDDEEVVRDVSNALLTHIGYKVEVAVEGVEAIEMYRKAMESEKPFDIVILDLTNKVGMGGAETIERLLEIDPDVRAIVATGYSNDPIMSNFREHGFRGALPKPFTLDQLKTILSEVIAIK